jgi:mRNA interferase MazF
MIGSNPARAGYASRVLVAGASARQSGLLMDSAVMTDNLATIHDAGIDRVLGIIQDLTEVDAALREALAL